MTPAETARSYVETMDARDWDAWERLLSPAVVYEVPQTRERIRGRDALRAFNTAYPGDWRLEPHVVVADDERAAIWMKWYDGDAPPGDAQVFLHFDEAGLITRVVDFWPEPYAPPDRPDGPLERY